jgi:hypothetical protein
MARSLHDNFLVGYEVKSESREIYLHTEWRDRGEPFERTIVFFSGVEAYDFRDDCLGNIIFDLEEVTAESIIIPKLVEIQERNRISGWPRFWQNSQTEALNYLKTRATRGFELSSSYGMSGWVLARAMQMLNEHGNIV